MTGSQWFRTRALSGIASVMCHTAIRAARGIPEAIAGSFFVDAAIAAIRAGLWLGHKVDVGLWVVPPGGVRVALGVEHAAAASAAGWDCAGPAGTSLASVPQLGRTKVRRISFIVLSPSRGPPGFAG